jgi:hypothetical protein
MATFLVCSRCGAVQETAILDQIPEDWQRSIADLYCPHCTRAEVTATEEIDDVLEEEVLYPPGPAVDDTFDEGYCDVCRGPCQGH